MTRLNVFLLVLLVISGLYLVQVSYDTRRLFSALDHAQTRERELNTDFDRLELARRGAATALRVDRLAQERLNMRAATPAVTEYLPGAAAVVASGPGVGVGGAP
jgi:cell division protein FtsL